MEAAKCSLPLYSPTILAYVGNRFMLSWAARKKTAQKCKTVTCMCVCLWCACMRGCPPVWRLEITSGIVPKVPSTLLRKTLTSLEFNRVVGYAVWPGMCPSLHPWSWDYRCMLPLTHTAGFWKCGSWGSNPSPYACVSMHSPTPIHTVTT